MTASWDRRSFRSLPWVVGCWALLFGQAVGAEPGALEAYVKKPDASFNWVQRRAGDLPDGSQFAELTLTSQTWKGVPWRHQLFIIRPKVISGDGQAVLLIDGGSWNDSLATEPPPGDNSDLPGAARLAAAATQMKSPVAVLRQVPFQPMFNGMKEDALISHTFVEFIKTGDSEWPLLLPMVKAAARGMDATQQYAESKWNLEIKSFTVTGASKRGWTTWLASAVDPRVNALAPMVIDTLNMGPQMQHQMASWGQYSEQIGDYTGKGLQLIFSTAPGKRLSSIVDPYSYREQITQPKLLILGTNDRYWTLDALNLYWDGLAGDKYICYVPNNGHGLTDLARVVGGLHALQKAAKGELKLPKLTWQYVEKDGGVELVVQSDPAPKQVSLWRSRASTRDFREASWSSEPIAEGDGKYRYSQGIPQEGFGAMFGEAVFDADGVPYYLSTNVRIVGQALRPADAAGQ